MALLDSLGGVQPSLSDKYFSFNDIGSKWFPMGGMASAGFREILASHRTHHATRQVLYRTEASRSGMFWRSAPSPRRPRPPQDQVGGPLCNNWIYTIVIFFTLWNRCLAEWCPCPPPSTSCKSCTSHLPRLAQPSLSCKQNARQKQEVGVNMPAS